MKTGLFFPLALAALCCFTAPAAHAQAPAPAATAAALPGYWNLETNLTTHDYTIVRFYDGHDQLVYEERLPQLCLNLNKGSRRCRQRTSQQLNLALQQVLLDPSHAPQATAALTQRLGQSRHDTHFYAVR